MYVCVYSYTERGSYQIVVTERTNDEKNQKNQNRSLKRILTSVLIFVMSMYKMTKTAE